MIKDKLKWYGVISGSIFLVLSTYMRLKFVFDSGKTAGSLFFVVVLSAFLTLLFGILSFPRWQSYLCLVIFIYALYCFTKPMYSLS